MNFKINAFKAAVADGKYPLLPLLVMVMSAMSPGQEAPASVAATPTVDNSQTAVSTAGASPLLISMNKEFNSRKLPDGSDAFICTGGFTASRRAINDIPGMDFQATNAVVFYSQQGLMQSISGNETQLDSPLGIYLEGDVRVAVDRVITQKNKPLLDTVFTADKIYYDFRTGQLFILDGVLKFDMGKEELPIYIRAKDIRYMDKGTIQARNLKLSNDSFYQPHLWLGAQKLEIEQDTPPNEYGQKIPNITIEDLTLNASGIGSLFWLPKVSGSLQSSPTPLKRLSSGLDSEFGFSIESEWDLPFILGIKQPTGTRTSLLIDEYTKRGPGAGIESEYKNEDSFGNFTGYMLHDDGEDQLGKLPSRDNVPPDDVFRGRIKWQHRQYLPYNWEATLQYNYISDQNFLESWYEREFDRESDSETSIYLKQQDKNLAFDLLYGFNVNDFEYNYLNEPKAGLYLAGQDIGEILVYQHDGYIARYQEYADKRLSPGFGPAEEPSNFYQIINPDRTSFGVSRHELTLPLNLGAFNFVPTVIATGVLSDYEGTNGFDYKSGEKDSFGQIAYGFRSSLQFWKLDRSVKSDAFNLDGLRHIVRPELSIFQTETTMDDFQTQDIYHFNLNQRWQTHRGPEGNKRQVDVWTLNTGITHVTNEVENSDLPGRYIYSRPEYQYSFEPYANYDLYNLGLTSRRQLNQSMHDFINADWSWSISDTVDYAGGVNHNLTDSELSSLDNSLSFAHESLVRYYIGHRYLANGDPLYDKAAQYVTAGASYQLNPKYTVAISTQYDLENNANAYSQFVILRRLPGWTTAFSCGWDATRDSASFQISVWPDNYEKAAIGNRRFTRMAP
ncbi:MAG: hypothetical protein JW745_05695 [Sedimentisphaerales bacterium]|nr:hypothetical protein [Sedimentisphaerales bacterium]MBN2842180.1 hypothetical protein [Sedimentisphaerales bacterium]